MTGRSSEIDQVLFEENESWNGLAGSAEESSRGALFDNGNRGVWVGEVARAREGNPNVLHRWRREFRQGRLRHDSVGFAASNFGPQTSDDSAGTSGCNVGRVLDGSTRED